MVSRPQPGYNHFILAVDVTAESDRQSCDSDSDSDSDAEDAFDKHCTLHCSHVICEWERTNLEYGEALPECSCSAQRYVAIANHLQVPSRQQSNNHRDERIREWLSKNIPVDQLSSTFSKTISDEK